MAEFPIHAPVMLDKVIAGIEPVAGGLYLDGTLGLGGHAAALLERAPQSQLCGLDQDAEALAIARERLAPFAGRVHLFQTQYAAFPQALEELGWNSINGALLDLGVSSLQLDRPERGFSFRESGPIDMRMDQNSGRESAWRLVNRGSHSELRDCLATLGEEPQAGRIARRIIEERQKKPIEDTLELAEIIRSAYPPAWRRSARRHPATRSFQALRMAVNDELGQLKRFLAEIPAWLAPGARLAIISFHSLEDRLVKHAIRRWSENGGEFRAITKKPLVPEVQEVKSNPRASSAKLRIAEKL